MEDFFKKIITIYENKDLIKLEDIELYFLNFDDNIELVDFHINPSKSESKLESLTIISESYNNLINRSGNDNNTIKTLDKSWEFSNEEIITEYDKQRQNNINLETVSKKLKSKFNINNIYNNQSKQLKVIKNIYNFSNFKIGLFKSNEKTSLEAYEQILSVEQELTGYFKFKINKDIKIKYFFQEENKNNYKEEVLYNLVNSLKARNYDFSLLGNKDYIYEKDTIYFVLPIKINKKLWIFDYEVKDKNLN